MNKALKATEVRRSILDILNIKENHPIVKFLNAILLDIINEKLAAEGKEKTTYLVNQDITTYDIRKLLKLLEINRRKYKSSRKSLSNKIPDQELNSFAEIISHQLELEKPTFSSSDSLKLFLNHVSEPFERRKN